MPTATTSPVDTARASAVTDPAERAVLSLEQLTELVGARAMWARGITGAGVNVAVIDTGVADVDALRERVIARVDVSADHDDPTVAYLDQHGHGTHMAGIIAGRAPGADPAQPDESFLGVAPEAGIVAVKVAGPRRQRVGVEPSDRNRLGRRSRRPARHPGHQPGVRGHRGRAAGAAGPPRRARTCVARRHRRGGRGRQRRRRGPRPAGDESVGDQRGFADGGGRRGGRLAVHEPW